MQIQAAVLRTHDGPFTLETVELAAPRPHEILVRIVGTGFCHTDVLPRSPQFLAQPPIICGHEGSGVVEAVGDAVTEFTAGDHVLASFDSCGRCENCRRSHPAYCREFFTRNLTGHAADDGGAVSDANGSPVASRWFGQSSFASHALVTERNAIKVGKGLPLDLLGPLGCGVQTGAGSILEALKIEAGSTVAIFGTGGVGLSAVMAARVAGAARIIAVDLHPSRLDATLEAGATDAVLGSDPDVAKQIRKLTGGGVQFALDTTAVPEVVTSALSALRPTGTLGLVGAGARPVTLAPDALSSGKNIMGILEGDVTPQIFIPRLIDLWEQGRFPFDRMITTYPMADINTAEADSASGATIKPVLVND
ncbi:NAD(P)-dependent alcohol dehydrogenase [Rhodococcus opacus]|uniref:Alcohol dehydrogenase n=1 Tax=Rhodococcus opacus TaxID=37919 RepID=A0A076EYH6_RHOOP|nr:NAD(P)-dependent alcohol dehydrogenase [Rhodococcus opacus]AII10831.1 alcohol dehydrogenase [Rhodococcus opacus]